MLNIASLEIHTALSAAETSAIAARLRSEVNNEKAHYKLSKQICSSDEWSRIKTRKDVKYRSRNVFIYFFIEFSSLGYFVINSYLVCSEHVEQLD